MSLPAISVVIPSWNAAATLPETLASILSQDHPDFEVIVVDDGSTDDTPEVLASWSAKYDGQLRCERIPNSGGPARPRNVGVGLARNPLVALFDSDDLMEPGKLSAQAAVFAAHPQAQLCFTDFMVIDEQGGVLQNSMLDDYQAFREHLQSVDGNDDHLPPAALFAGSPLHHALIHANFIGTSSVVARRDLLGHEGGFDEQLNNGDDIDMWLKLARSGSVFAFLDVIGHRYRKTAGGISARGWRRLPAVAAIRERQRPYIDDQEVIKYLDSVILACKLGEAWGLRGEKRYEESLRAYRDAQDFHPTWTGLKGIWLTRLAQLLRR